MQNNINIWNQLQKCQNDIGYFCKEYVEVNHPTKGLIPMELLPFQRRVVDNYEKHQYCILKKFRQSGLTTNVILYALWKCLFFENQKIMVTTKTFGEAKHLFRLIELNINSFPPQLKGMVQIKDARIECPVSGSFLEFNSIEGARGKILTLLIIDEAAFIPDMFHHWKMLSPGIIQEKTQCIVLSTVNGLDNWFYLIYKNAESGNNNFHIVNTDYLEHPDYQCQDFLNNTKIALGNEGWHQEVLGNWMPYRSENVLLVEGLYQLAKKYDLSKKEFALIEQVVNLIEKN